MQLKYSWAFVAFVFIQLAACGSGEPSATAQTVAGSRPVLIQGSFNNLQKGYVRLEHYNGEIYVPVDSVEVKGKDFSITAKVAEQDFYRLQVLGRKEVPLVLTGDEKKVNIQFNIQTNDVAYKIQNAPLTLDYLKINDLLAATRRRSQEIEAAFQAATTEDARDALREEYLGLQATQTRKMKALLDSLPTSIALIPGLGSIDAIEEYDFVKSISVRLNKHLSKSKYVGSFNQRFAQVSQQYEAVKHLAVGQPAPEIALPTPDGKELKLSELRGKLVLIDFWASWCGPCRKENPNVVRLYSQYKDKGFEIYGVSLDRDRDAWLKAIAQDQLTWKHVSDLQFWQSAGAQTYKVQSIPQTYLVDKDGKIIAKNLRGKALERKIAEILQ